MNKIIIHYTSPIFCCLLFITITFAANAQQDVNKYGLTVINKLKDYKLSIAADENKKMVNIRTIRDIVLDLAYTKRDNFTKTVLYPPTQTTYLRKQAINALKEIQKELQLMGLGLKIWDAYRPYAVTEKMWLLIKDERYVANPEKGSGHNRGIAVDLTLVHLDSKNEIPMGTGFDNFSDTAHADFKQLPAEVLANRKLLRTLMESHGFVALDTEWWHYYFKDAKNYELLDLTFKDLSKANKKYR